MNENNDKIHYKLLNKGGKGVRNGNGGGKFDQSSLYACMKKITMKPLLQLIYTDTKRKKREGAL
jgi:hypothetical protein